MLSVTFLKHFIQWKNPMETLQYGAALSLVVIALMMFQFFSHRAKENQQKHKPNVQALAKQEMFQTDKEEHQIKEDEVHKE